VTLPGARRSHREKRRRSHVQMGLQVPVPLTSSLPGRCALSEEQEQILKHWVHEFAEAVMDQKLALEQGKPKLGNRYADVYLKAWGKLREQGDEGREALATLFEDERPDVRAAAAAFLLRYRTKEAKRVLREVAKGEGLTAFEASEALQRWREGDWHLDPEE
jgi:hypothetical protein